MTNKIGILTFQNTVNYGAVLQTYALQRCLQSFSDNEVEVINYFNDAVTQRETPVSFSSIRSVKQFVKFILNNRAEKRKYKAVKSFCNDNIKYSKLDYTESSNPCFDDYKAIVAGSDQIWNLNLTNGDVNYMLEGYKGKGYSYAASIGTEKIENEVAIEAIKRLRMVSVRESTAQVELRSHGVESELVCDPTFLIKKDEWFRMLPKPKIKRKYILLYQMTTSDKIFRFAKDLARKKDAVLINANPISLQIFKSRCVRDASPLEWLSLIKNAECVVTNSFHGLAFSINFEKEFYTEIRDNEAKNSSRLFSLLNILGLSNRNISSSDFVGGPIDYAKVTDKLDSYRAVSCNYISRIVKDINYAE